MRCNQSEFLLLSVDGVCGHTQINVYSRSALFYCGCWFSGVWCSLLTKDAVKRSERTEVNFFALRSLLLAFLFFHSGHASYCDWASECRSVCCVCVCHNSDIYESEITFEAGHQPITLPFRPCESVCGVRINKRPEPSQWPIRPKPLCRRCQRVCEKHFVNAAIIR